MMSFSTNHYVQFLYSPVEIILIQDETTLHIKATAGQNNLRATAWKYGESDDRSENSDFLLLRQKTTAKSKFLLARPKKAQLVKVPFIVFRLTRLLFTGQTNHLDMVYL